MATKKIAPPPIRYYKDKMHQCNDKHLYIVKRCSESDCENGDCIAIDVIFEPCSGSYSYSPKTYKPKEVHEVDFKNCPYCGGKLFDFEEKEGI